MAPIDQANLLKPQGKFNTIVGPYENKYSFTHFSSGKLAPTNDNMLIEENNLFDDIEMHTEQISEEDEVQEEDPE